MDRVLTPESDLLFPVDRSDVVVDCSRVICLGILLMKAQSVVPVAFGIQG